jgi:hypothetical protein
VILRAEESGWEQGCYVMEPVLVQNREITSRTNEHRSALLRSLADHDLDFSNAVLF